MSLTHPEAVLVAPATARVSASPRPRRTPPVADALGGRVNQADIVTVPVIFIAVLKAFGLAFAVYPSRRDPAGWCFKFQRRFVLEMDAAGRTQWLCVDPAIRVCVEAALVRAVELHRLRARVRPRRRPTL